MYDNNYISSSKDMHNYLDQLSGLQPVFRKSLSRSSECENQYTKPFRLSKISESTFSKRGYEKDCYQKDKKVIEWKKPKLEDKAGRMSKSCFPGIRDPRLKTSMVGLAVPNVNKPDISIYDTYRAKFKEKKFVAETDKRCDDETDKINGNNDPAKITISKEKEHQTRKAVDSKLKRTSLTESCKTEKKHTSSHKASSKLNVNSDLKENTSHPNAQDVSKKPVDDSFLRRKSQVRCIKIKVFPPLSKEDYENIWTKTSKVVLSEIPCSIRKKYKIRPVNKSTDNSKHTVTRSVQTNLDFTKPISVSESTESLKTCSEHPKQKPDRENFLSSMEKELDDTKKLISSTYCDSILVDPKVMSMSKTLQKACDTNSNASSLAFKLKESPKSPGKCVMKKGHLFNLEKLRNSLQGTMTSSRNLSTNSFKVCETVLKDRSRSDDRKSANHHERLNRKDDLLERKSEPRSTHKHSHRDQKDHAERKNFIKRRHSQQSYVKSKHGHKHQQSKHKPIESSHSKEQSDSSASLSIQYPQISSTNDPPTSIPDKDGLTTTKIADNIKKTKPTSRWDVVERDEKPADASNDSKSEKSYSSLDKVSRIVSDSRPKQKRTTSLNSNISSAIVIQDQNLHTTSQTPGNTLNNMSIELKSNTTSSSSGDRIGIINGVTDENLHILTANDIALYENVSNNAEASSTNVVPNASNDLEMIEDSSENLVSVNSNSDQNESSSLELQTSVICVKSPMSVKFMDPELNEFALESFVSEIEVETTVVADTVLEHATVSCAQVTQTPILNQIPVMEQSKPLVQNISVRKISLSEQILADTSTLYGQTNVFFQNREGCQTSTRSDNLIFEDKELQQSRISSELGEHNSDVFKDVIQNSCCSMDVQYQNNCESKVTDCEFGVETCKITICESNLVTDKLVVTDQNDNSLKHSEDHIINGKAIESSQTVTSTSEENELRVPGSEISKVSDLDQLSISLMTHGKKMEDVKEPTNTNADVKEQNMNTDLFLGKQNMSEEKEEPSIKECFSEHTNQKEEIGNSNGIGEAESSCYKERIEGMQIQNISSSIDQTASNLEKYPQLVKNNSEKNTMFMVSQSLLYEDISNSSISEYISPTESKIKEDESIKDVSKPSCSGDIADEQSKESTLVRTEEKEDLRSSFPTESSPPSTNPDTQQSCFISEMLLSDKTNGSVAEDLALSSVEIEQPYCDPSLLVSKNLHPEDGDPDSDATKEIPETVHETSSSQLQDDKSIDALRTVCEISKEVPDVNVDSSNIDKIAPNINDVSMEEDKAVNLSKSETLVKDTSGANVLEQTDTDDCEKNHASGDMNQLREDVSSNNITLIVDDNSLEGCSEILISKIDDESNSSSSTDFPDSQTESENKPDDKRLFENDSKEMPYLEFVKNCDNKSKTIKSDQFKTLKPNELDIADQKSFFEGCPLFFSKQLCVNEGMKLPVRIATYNDDQETTQKSSTETIGVENDLSKPVLEITEVPVDINSVTEHQQSDETILPETAIENSVSVAPLRKILPKVSNTSNECASGLDQATKTDSMTRAEISPSTPQSNKEYRSALPEAINSNTVKELVSKPMEPQPLDVRNPVFQVIPPLMQNVQQSFVTIRPCSTFLPPGANNIQILRLPIAQPNTVQPIFIKPVQNQIQFHQNSSLMISQPLHGVLPHLAQNCVAQSFNIAKPPKSVGPKIGHFRYRPLTKTTKKLIPQLITTDSIVRPIVSIKHFDTTNLPQKHLDNKIHITNNVTDKPLTDTLNNFETNTQLNQTNQTSEFQTMPNVTTKDCEEHIISSSDDRRTHINGTNVVTFPLKLPGDTVASYTPTNSNLGTILKISETVKSSHDISKFYDVNEIISNRHELGQEFDIPVPSDQIINSDSCIEQHTKEKPNIDNSEINSNVEHESNFQNSDRSKKIELTKESDNKNPHIHISIPLSRIACSHISAINPSSVSSTSLESSPPHIYPSSYLSPPKLSPAIQLTNRDDDIQVEGDGVLSDCGSTNTDETQVWKKCSSVEEIMSDETLIYSCDELEDIDQELKLNEKLKSEKQRILKVVQKLREELSENKMENNDSLIRKRRRSQVLESVDLKSLADTEPEIQDSNQEGSSIKRAGKKVHRSRGSKHKQKMRKKRQLSNEVLYDSDLDELPVIHPPKRRRLQKLNMQETAIRSNLDSDRIRLELPLHNWLEHKIKLGTESSKSSSEDVPEDSDVNNETPKKKTEKNSKRDKSKSPVTKSKETKDQNGSESCKTLSKVSDVLPEKPANAAVATSYKASSPEKSDAWRKQLALSRSKSQSKQNVSNGTDQDYDIDKKQVVEDDEEINVEVQDGPEDDPENDTVLSLQPVQDDNTNTTKSPHSDVDILQSDDLNVSNQGSDENLEDGQLVVDETPTTQKKEDQNVLNLPKMEETNTKPENVKLELNKSTDKAIEEEKNNADSHPDHPDSHRDNYDSQTYDLTTTMSDVNQPLDLCLKVSQDTQIKTVSQKSHPKVQLVHPQVISSTAKKKEENASLIQTTKMAIQSISSNKTPLQNDQNSSEESSNAANQESPVSDSSQVDVCDFSMKKKSNIDRCSQIHLENQESNTIICLPATSDNGMTPVENTPPATSKKLPDDLEFQRHLEELRHLEHLARRKEQEHAQVLALSRKKVETIMKLKLQKKRAAALSLSTFEKEQLQLHVSTKSSSPRSSYHKASKAGTRKEKLSLGHSPSETEKGENLCMHGDKSATSNDSHKKSKAGSNKGTSKENKSDDMKNMTGRITEALQQAIQNKTIKNPNSESDKQIAPRPAHQRVKSTIPHDEPCKLPNDASSMCPFRLRADSLTDPSINPSKKSMDKPIQVAHNQPAFQTAGSLIVPNIPNSQKDSLGYNFSGMNESTKSRTLKLKRSHSYNKEDDPSKHKNEVIDLTIETSSVLHDPPPLKRIKRDDVMEVPNKSPLNNHHLAVDESRQILRSPNQRLSSTFNGQEVFQPVPRYQLNYGHSPPGPVYQQNNMVPQTPSSTPPVQNRLQYDRSSPYSRVTSPHALYPIRPGLSNPMMRLQNVPTFNTQIRPEQQMQKQIHQAPYPAMHQNNPYGSLEPGEIITSRFQRGWNHPSQMPNQHMPEVAERRMFPGHHNLSPQAMKQVMTQHFLQQQMQRIPSEQSHHPNGPPSPYRATMPNASTKVFSPHGMAQPLQEPMPRSNEIQYPAIHNRPVAAIVENNRACCVCNKVSCFICSGCRTVWYCSYPCQNAHWKVHSQYCKKP